MIERRARKRRLAWWDTVATYPLVLASLLFLATYSIEVLDTGLSPGWRRFCDLAQSVVWVLFTMDYAWRLYHARRRWHYFSRHLLDLAIVALPMLRPLRLMRVVILLRVVTRNAAVTVRGRLALFIVGATSLLVYCGSLAVLQAERHVSGAKITTFGDAVWWSITTITTVGYGDYYPVTITGRLVAAGEMISGISLIGLVTASFASWLVGRVRDDADEMEAATRRDLHRIADQLDRIESRLTTMESAMDQRDVRL